MTHKAMPITATESSIELITKAEIDMQISTAKAFPRPPMSEVLAEIYEIATLSEETIESCMYALPRGGKIIEGPSVRLAEIVAHAYGNIRAGRRTVQNDGKKVVGQGICHDLQKNVAVTVEIEKKITNAQGQTFTEDMQIMTANAASAIAYRNAVFSCVPKALVNTVYDRLRGEVKAKGEELVKRREKALKWFDDNGVPVDKMLTILKCKTVNDIDGDHLVQMTGMKSAIQSGAYSVKDMTNPEQPADVKKEEMRVKKDTNPNGNKLP